VTHEEDPTADVELIDVPALRAVTAIERRYAGMKWDVVTETVQLDDATSVRRDVVVHPGAVGIVALDDHGRLLLLRQYRHPVRSQLWELPAGLLDVAGEDAVAAAARELFEEAHLRAAQWDVLVDVYSSPGLCSEAYRIYLARGLSEVPVGDRHVPTAEERDMPVRWVDLDAAIDAVTAGHVHNAMAVAGIFAAARARDQGWATLRASDTAWPERSQRYFTDHGPPVTDG
jgi:8-oxo-dGTP pyrophosphatase MutT (NUDIX family)